MTSDDMSHDLHEAFARRVTDFDTEGAARIVQRVGAHQRRRAARVGTLGLAAVLVAAVAGVLAAESGDRGTPTAKAPAGDSAARNSPSAGSAGSASSQQGQQIQLAGYKLMLPPTYASAHDRCMPELGTPYIPVHSDRFLVTTQAGRCLEVILVPNTAKPSDATPVAVGSRQGFIARTANLIMLYVTLPSPDERFALLVADSGTTQEQLIQIAANSR